MKALLRGATVFHTDDGPKTAMPVLFIHGFPLNHAMWRPQIEALQENFRVITYDIRGLGRSETGNGPYSIGLFANDLFALMDHLQIPDAALCGLSMGGYVALQAAQQAPRRVRGLILCDTRSEADSDAAKAKRAQSIRTVQDAGVQAFVEGFMKPLFAPRTWTRNPSVIRDAKAMAAANTAVGICRTLSALASRADMTASLPRITVPTLLLVGAHDAITPPALMRAMHARIPGSSFHIIADAGHLSNLENPRDFNKHVLAFLKKLR